MGAYSAIEAAQNLGKYTLIEKLGEGYLGPVYRGFDQDLGRPVVVRILCDGIKWDPKLEEAFDRECRAVAGLHHPNIAGIFECAKEGQHRFIVMESLGGGTLRNLIAQNSAVPVETKLSIMIQVAEGLSHAHKKGILHRDLGPGKIHLAPDGSVKIRDFAIAHVLMKYLPHPAVRWGAPIYLCPEQIQHKDCDERSDIFSAGTIFYELLTHFHPFHDRDSNKALDNILSEAQIPTFEKFPEAPPGVWAILRSCLSRDPDDRYRSTDELADACRELLKSLAEDSQIMLAELYASLSPLRKAAAQPNASQSAIKLQEGIQKLLSGEREPDYAYLDQLMTILMDQYPAIQAAASAPPAIDSLCPQLPPETPDIAGEVQAGVQEGFGQSPPEPLQAHAQPEPLAGCPPPAQQSPEGEPAQPAGQAPTSPERPMSPVHEAASAETAGTEAEETYPENDAGEGVKPFVEPATPGSPESAEPESPALPIMPADQSTARETESTYIQPPPSASRHRRRIPRPSYRLTAALLSLLVIAAAAYIAFGTDAAASARKAWNAYMPFAGRILHSFSSRRSMPPEETSGLGNSEDSQDSAGQDTSEILLKEARAFAAENRTEESTVLIRRILEMNPGYQPAIAALREIEAALPGARTSATARQVEGSVSRISALISSGKLQAAKSEMDRLQQSNPDAPGLSGLRRRWQAAYSKQAQEEKRKEEEQLKLISRQKEDEWTRQVDGFFGQGKYDEARGALTLWLSENPGSSRAQELNNRLLEIQRTLKAYTAAMAENRYPEALNALSNAERLNPADPSFAELRRQAESRRAAARAILTVYRLGAKANLLLDGRPIGKDGEVENESIPIGSHTLAVQNGGGQIASRIHDYVEGQQIALVYDLVRQTLRPMTESDRRLLAQRRAIENVERFPVEHDHGVFRGGCRGVLLLNSLDVAYSTPSGSHGFRIPFKLLRLKLDGRTAGLFYVSDGSQFQTFKFQDAQSADKFKRKWDELKELLQ